MKLGSHVARVQVRKQMCISNIWRANYDLKPKTETFGIQRVTTLFLRRENWKEDMNMLNDYGGKVQQLGIDKACSLTL